MSFLVEKDFEHAGLRCVVTFGDMGHRCGYVGVTKEHPLYGKDYSDYLDIKKSDVEGEVKGRYFTILMAAWDEDERARLDFYFDCHGGLTFADGGKGSIYPVKSDLWWFGFDCAHYGDGKDLDLALEKFPDNRSRISARIAVEASYGFTHLGEGPVRTTEYVEAECRRLAEQLSEFAKGD